MCTQHTLEFSTVVQSPKAMIDGQNNQYGQEIVLPIAAAQHQFYAKHICRFDVSTTAFCSEGKSNREAWPQLIVYRAF
jgi:hypothetical protein